ncbi:hypothetical protein [Tateyamaria sp.]|uniref:hypothetical protein n=1 Tax=Tateyamaria sp. TaxID=1929288 RepID=UPI00329FE5B1
MSQQNELTFNIHSLKLTVKSYLDKITEAGGWVGPLGVAATLLSTLIVADFKETMGISGEVWAATYIIVALACCVWLVLSLYKTKKVEGFEEFFEKLLDSAEYTKSECVLMLAVAKDANNIPRLLVYYDSFRGSFFLPWVSKHVSNSASTQAMRSVRHTFGCEPEDVSAFDLHELRLSSQKTSVSSGKLKHYDFEFTYLTFNKVPKFDMQQSPFQSGGKQFFWATLSELSEHPLTRSKNYDVFDHIEKYAEEIFDSKPGPSIQNSIRLTENHNLGAVR